MNRTQRVRRIAELVKSGEYQARRDLALANDGLRQAETSLVSVFDQCREVAQNDDDLPFVFGRALLQSGWMAAEARTEDRDVAAASVQDSRAVWEGERTRVDALARLLGRLELEDASTNAKRQEDHVADLVNSRFPQLVAQAG